MNDLHNVIEKAIKETKNLQQGEIFLVRDLFKGYEWNRISKGERLLIGSLFLSYVSLNTCNISVIEKGVSGQQRYKKM